MATVVVTDGEERAALAVVRSLGRSGHRIYVASQSADSLASASRYAKGSVQVPGPLKDEEGYATALADLVERRRAAVLLPITEASLLAILPRRDDFGDARIPFPSFDVFQRACDKAKVLDAAKDLAIAVPTESVLLAEGDLLRLDRRTLEFPLVLKPSRSVAGSNGAPEKLYAVHVKAPADFEPTIRRMPPHAYPLLLQRRVLGPGVGIFLLTWQGELLASFAHRRLREKPPSGGVSVYRESIAADPALLEQSRALLERLEWQGVAMVEYKIDRATGTPYLMEINPRFWGSTQLAIDAGVDFPALLVSAALGDVPSPVTTYRVGVRSRWWWGDLDHLLIRMRRSKQELSLPEDAHGRVRTLIEFLAAFQPRSRNEVFRFSDPLPFVRESVDWIRQP